MPPIVLTSIIVYFILLIVLIAVAYTPRLFCHYTLAKGILSCGFVVLSLLTHHLTKANGLPYWPMLTSFLLAAAGDILIGVANNRFGEGASHSSVGLVGVICFGTAHFFYLLWFLGFIEFHWYYLALPTISALILLKVTALPCFYFGKRCAAAIPYYSMVTLMFSVAIGVSCAVLNGAAIALNPYCLASGVALFLISDILILFLYFYQKSKSRSLRFWNLTTYYIGQLLIALCVLA